MLKEKLRDDVNASSQRECKWRNVYYSKDGKVLYSRHLWPSQELANHDALKRIDTVLSGQKSALYNSDNPLGVTITASNYSWHMQIPILE